MGIVKSTFGKRYSEIMKPDRKAILIFLSGILLVAAICTVQIYTDIVHGSVYYILVAFTGLWILHKYRYLYAIGIVATIGITLGYILGQEAGTGPLINRIFSCLTVWAGVVFTHHYRRITQTEQRYKSQLGSLFENASEAIIFIDSAGRILLSNPGAERIFGYSPKELFGKSIDELLPERFRHNHDKHRHSFVSNPSNRRIGVGTTVFGLNKNGKEVPVEISLSTYKDRDELFIIAFVTDITKRKEQEEKIAAQYLQMQQCNLRLENEVRARTYELEEALDKVRAVNNDLLRENEERKQVEAQLRKTQMLYTAIANNFPDGIIGVLDRDLRYVFVEGKELQSIGLAKETSIGEHIFDDVHMEMTKLAEEKIRPSFDGKSVSFEVVLGTNFYEVKSIPLIEVEGSIVEVLVVIRNITKHKKFEEHLLKSLEKEKQLNVLKSRFVTSVSHEFRTPLSTILSSVFLLENYVGPDVENNNRVHHNRIKRSVNSLTELLDDFLSLGKLEEGKVKVIYSEFYVKEFLDELISEMNTIRKKDQQILLRFTGEDEPVMLDKCLLTNIMSNLISNAIKYSPPDGVIEIHAEVKKDLFLASIKDNGMGIPEGEQKHIFKRFFRAHNATNIQGTGLGLNLVRKYVRLMKGYISFRSTQNQGSTFYVNIPVAIPNNFSMPKSKVYA